MSNKILSAEEWAMYVDLKYTLEHMSKPDIIFEHDAENYLFWIQAYGDYVKRKTKKMLKENNE